MVADPNPPWQHQLDFKFYNLVPPTMVRIYFPNLEDADLTSALPMIQLGAGYTDSPVSISNLLVQSQRIQFEIVSAPSLLPISLKITCPGPFVYGWLLVTANVQTVIATQVEQIRVVGPGYWALPLWRTDQAGWAAPTFIAPRPSSNSAAAKPAEKAPESKPAPVKPATGATAP
jgi:hypothetical protein